MDWQTKALCTKLKTVTWCVTCKLCIRSQIKSAGSKASHVAFRWLKGLLRCCFNHHAMMWWPEKEEEGLIIKAKTGTVCPVCVSRPVPESVPLKAQRRDKDVDENREEDQNSCHIIHPVQLGVFTHVVQIVLHCCHRVEAKQNNYRYKKKTRGNCCRVKITHEIIDKISYLPIKTSRRPTMTCSVMDRHSKTIRGM